jgi:glutamate racemase
VELGDLHGIRTRELVERYTEPLLARGADTLILGCTHYPFLSSLIQEVVGENVVLVDTGTAVARHLQRRLQTELPDRPPGDTTAQFFTSGDAAQASRIISALWGSTVEVQPLPLEFL